MRIIFMGTPDFAVESLKVLVEANCEVVAVITAPDKPSGRGKKIQQSPVKTYALSQDIPVLQPPRLKNPEFLETLKAYNADLQVVVAFRMLPELVWAMPKLGTFNLHGSLLPQYRGAAPINWAVINGETETGVTTFFIEKEIDTGKIIFNFIRGLSPYPGAWTKFKNKKSGETGNLKIFNSKIINHNSKYPLGQILTDNKTYLNITTGSGILTILSLQIPGKKRLNIEDLLRGYDAEQIELC